MKPSSAKNKGRTLQKLVREKLISTFDFHPDDVRSTSMGAGGEDLLFSNYARVRFPFSVECKNLAKIACFRYYEQATANAGGHIPLVVMKENRSSPLVLISLDHFLSLVKENTK